MLLLAGIIPGGAFGAARGYVVADWSPVPVQTPRAAIANGVNVDYDASAGDVTDRS